MTLTRRTLLACLPFLKVAVVDQRAPWEIYRDEVGELSFAAVWFVTRLQTHGLHPFSTWQDVATHTILPLGFTRAPLGAVITRDMLTVDSYRSCSGPFDTWRALWRGPSYYIGHRVGEFDVLVAQKVAA